PAPARALARGLHELGGDEPLDDRRDGRLGDVRALGDLRPGDRALAKDRLEDRLLAELAQQVRAWALGRDGQGREVTYCNGLDQEAGKLYRPLLLGKATNKRSGRRGGSSVLGVGRGRIALAALAFFAGWGPPARRATVDPTPTRQE